MPSLTAPPTQLATSDFNLEKLNTEQFEQHLSASIDVGSNLAVFGLRGSGKTSIAKQRIQATGFREEYMNLSVYERPDIGGVNDFFAPREKSNKEHFISYILPRVYQSMIEGTTPVVLLLDEFDKVEKEIEAPLLELTQEHSINGRKLPNLRCCIFTGNLISEGSRRPSLPLLDRTEKYLLETSAVYWLRWAYTVPTEIHPSVIAFIEDHPDCLHTANEMEESFSSASPRGWHLGSRLIYAGEKNGWPLDLINQKICGQIGKRIGLQYKLYLFNYRTLLPLVEKIFASQSWENEWKGLTPTEKLYVATIVCTRFSADLDKATKDNPPPSIEPVGKFMQKCGYENVMMGVKRCITMKRILKYDLDINPHWKDALLNPQRAITNQG